MTQQTQTLPARAKPPISTGGQVAALVPQNLEEAFRLAGALAASGMAPRGMDKPEQVMVAILAGAEIGFAPYQAMQSFAIVNNKATLWGDAIPALLWSHRFKLKEWFDNEDEPTKAFCRVTRPDGEEIERTYSVGDAKKASLLGKQGPWQTNQKRMLQMRARAFAARDGAADVLKGLHIREEVEDYGHARDVTPAPTGLRARLEAAQSAASEGFTATQAEEEQPAHDAETGEILDAEVEEITQAVGEALDGDDLPAGLRGDDEAEAAQDARPAVSTDILHWADELEGNLLDYAGVDPLREDWTARKDELKDADPERFRELNGAVAKRAADIGSGA